MAWWCLARTLGTYVTASARDLVGTLRGPEPGAAPPGDARPTLDDLDRAGAAWSPLTGTDDLEATYDNGYVVVRHAEDPYGPVWIVDEDVWEAFLDGDDEDLPFDDG